MRMKQNWFQLESQFHKEMEGTAMGNPLFPLLADLFMIKFKMEASKKLYYFSEV